MSSSNDNNENTEWCDLCGNLSLTSHFRKLPICGHRCFGKCFSDIKQGWCCKCFITELPDYEAIPWVESKIDWDNVSQSWLNSKTDQCTSCGFSSIHANFRSVPNCLHKICVKCYHHIQKGWCCFC